MISLCFPISQIRQGLDLDPDDFLCTYREPAPDLVRQLDAVLEATDDAHALRLSSLMIALEAYLEEPYAIFPGERDAEGIDVTEYPFA